MHAVVYTYEGNWDEFIKENAMAGSVNKVILVGKIGREPEGRTFQNGGKESNYYISTSTEY